MIRFKANGKVYSRQEEISISCFLKELKLPSQSVIVEYNKEFLHKHCYEKTLIKNNDTLEIVRAFGGG